MLLSIRGFVDTFPLSVWTLPVISILPKKKYALATLETSVSAVMIIGDGSLINLKLISFISDSMK